MAKLICTVPDYDNSKLRIIATYGEIREVDEDVAQFLISTGAWALVAQPSDQEPSQEPEDEQVQVAKAKTSSKTRKTKAASSKAKGGRKKKTTMSEAMDPDKTTITVGKKDK